ncbi:Vascular-related unknown protein 1 [Linum perenne]
MASPFLLQNFPIINLIIYPLISYIYIKLHVLGLTPFIHFSFINLILITLKSRMEDHDHGNYEISDQEEESGWTGYFEDFCCDQDADAASMSLCSSSMVSDASSLPAAMNHHNINNKKNSSSLPLHQIHLYSGNHNAVLPKKLNFKNRRARDISSIADDSLEDTASSPVNSPKVVMDFRQIEINPRMTTSGGNIDPFGTTTSMGNKEEEMRMNYNDNNKEECTDLKKKGLCLVPMSMILHYIG